MPGALPKKPEERRRRNVPQRGEWQPTDVTGWQHGPIPTPPAGLSDLTIVAWEGWFRGWFASHWFPEDLPGLRHAARLYETVVVQGKTGPASELRQVMDDYGITPYGAARLRWAPPKPRTPASAPAAETQPAADESPYSHLRRVK